MTATPLLLGHRGARYSPAIAENTFEAFDCCLADGCDGFEFDVRQSADGQLLLCHDADFGGLQVTASSLAVLRDCARAAGVSGPVLLEDVLTRHGQRAFLDIELKVARIEAQVVALLRACAPQRGLVISSFLPEVLKAVRGLDDELPLGLLAETREALSAWRELPVQYVLPRCELVDAMLVEELHRAGRKVVTWTVNSPEEVSRVRRLGIDGMISDDTRMLAQCGR
jgi:glycerophosphoryl diester phosphodiesterase